MSITYHERPGVYSDVDASSIYASTVREKIVALIGVSDADAGLYTVTDCASGLTALGEDTELGKMLRLACRNGAGTVLCCPVAADSVAAYTAALAYIAEVDRVAYICVGSELESVQLLLKQLVMERSSERGECIGIVGLSDPEVTSLTARAAALNCERMVLVGPDVYVSGEDDPVGGQFAAAALCGVLAAQTDPALPLNGQILKGFTGVTTRYNDTQVDTLVRAGVTILEMSAGNVTVMRGITTRATSGGSPDLTWRELTTTLIIDDVIPAIRDSLRSRFVRVKNNAVTRAAIRSQVVIALEDRINREIIESYDSINVHADTQDPTICVVEFGFTVVHGLNRIHLSAHISV